MTQKLDQDRKLRFTPDWRASVLALLLLPLLLSLGFWQLQRAEEKRLLQALFEQRQLAGPINIGALAPDSDMRYQPVRLSGEFINDKALLLDNKIYKGRVGYEIIMPFRVTPVAGLEGRHGEALADGTTAALVMVNRGWVAGDYSRRSLPSIPAVSGKVSLLGEIYVPQGEMMVLGEDRASGWPRVVQTVDIEALSPEYGTRLFPYTVRLRAASPAVLQPNWVVVNVQPEKHTAYAVQWFVMAVTLLIIGFLANTNAWALFQQRKEDR